MNKKKDRVSEKKYQKTIYVWISAFFIVAQLLFLIAILFKVNSQEIQNNYEMNEQIFSQVAQNVERSNEEIYRICNSLFCDPQVSKMMYENVEDDILQLGEEFRNVWAPVCLGNSQIHSIYVYNGITEKLFSSYRYLTYQDEEIKEMLKKENTSVLRKPFVRTLEGLNEKDGGTRVITYVIYDTSAQLGKVNGAVVVNIDWNRFMEGIEQLLTFSNQEKSQIFIIDQNRGIIDKTDRITDAQVENQILEMVGELPGTEDTNFNFETKKIFKDKYGMFFINIPSINWNIVKVQDYEEIFSNVSRQIRTLVVISAIFCVVMVLSTYFLAKKIYSPIGNLVEKVKSIQKEDGVEGNEIQYLNNVYENLALKYKEYQEKYSRNSILLHYNIQNLLEGGKENTDVIWDSLEEMNPSFFKKDNFFGVSILQINGYQQLEKKSDPKEMELYKFVIENILSELLENQGYQSMMIQMEKNKEVLIVHGESIQEKEYRKDMEECFRITNENINKYVAINCSIMIGPYQKGRETIHDSYIRVENSLPYLYAYGRGTALFYDHKTEQEEKKKIEDVIKQLSIHIKEGEKNEIEKDFLSIKQLVKCQSSERVVEFIISQAIYILHLIDGKANSTSMERYSEILQMDNWEDISANLEKILMEVLTPESKQTQKTSLLVSTIQKIIKEEYADPNLCLQKIAEMVKMSGQYVGRIFKSSSGMSVAEYINSYRLEKSIEIMMKTGCTVNEVVEKVGIENESQYYRMFKKRYGNTPKAYMLELMVENHRKE